MPKVQVATVLSQDARKRKRPQKDGSGKNVVAEHNLAEEEASEAGSSTVTKIPTKTFDGGKKLQRIQKPNSNAAPLLRRSLSSDTVTSDIPWPDHFAKLEATHRALNIVYTFCCTRKHLATT